MSTLPSKSELFDVLNTCCNYRLGLEQLSLERVSQIVDYLKNIQKEEIYNSFTFTIDNLVKQYLSYLEGEESDEFQKLQRLTDEERHIKIAKDATDILKTFHHPQFGNKYKEFE